MFGNEVEKVTYDLDYTYSPMVVCTISYKKHLRNKNGVSWEQFLNYVVLPVGCDKHEHDDLKSLLRDQAIDEEVEDDEEEDYSDYEDEWGADGIHNRLPDGTWFADPGNPNSSLRAATKNNPRIHPCPNGEDCVNPNGPENLLTAADVANHYQCDACGDAADRGGY